MELSILRTVLGNGNKDKFDSVVAHYIKTNKLHTPGKFSHIFPLLFAENNREGQENKWENLLSFLEPISKAFTHVVQTTWCHDAARQLLQDVKSEDTHQENVLQFVAYLIEVYVTLLSWYSSNMTAEIGQNLFRFMTDFPLPNTRVVMVFNTPSGKALACGYALHGAQTDSTSVVLNNLKEELLCVGRFSQNGAPLTIDGNILTQAQKDANLCGWINQGVLLMNAHLTYRNPVWEAFCKCLVGVLSSTCAHLVYILAGRNAQKLVNSIHNPTQHFIRELYHPTSKEPFYEDLCWDTNLPFINANFFLHQKTQNLVDWHSISENTPGLEGRFSALRQLFGWILAHPNARSQNPAPFIIQWESAEDDFFSLHERVVIQVSPHSAQNEVIWSLTMLTVIVNK